MATERWWGEDKDEIYWVEITNRADLGTDLNAPQVTEDKWAYPGYGFVREVREGDIVLHYQARPISAITHWSRAVGDAYEDEVIWGAHGQASGRGPVTPYPRPGVRRPLDGPYPLPKPITLDDLRALEPQIREVRDALRAEHADESLFFPFQISDSRPIRAAQTYVAKFPRRLLEAIPGLDHLEELASATQPLPGAPSRGAPTAELGGDYRSAQPKARTATRQPFSVDPDRVDRALESHASTQDSLADAVRAAQLSPRSPAPGEPVFDIAWDDGEAIVVAEVKSLTKSNEEKQLRLALGQVLRYAHLLGGKGRPVRRVIAIEREPSDPSWLDLCESAAVALVWPGTFETLFEGAA